MTYTDFKEIGAKLKAAFRLSTRPLAVYGSEVLPASIPPMTRVNRCFAVSMYRMATVNEISAIYVSADTREDCCLGGLYHMGYIPIPDEIKYFVSTGRKDVRGGAAEYLKADPELVERCMLLADRYIHRENILSFRHVKPFQILGLPSDPCVALVQPSKYVILRHSFTSIGTTHFTVIVPWGSACSTYITFPAGLADKTPLDTAFMGPQDPTQNHSLPPEMMAIGIPVDTAERMVKNLDASFIIWRPQVAFPNHEKQLKR